MDWGGELIDLERRARGYLERADKRAAMDILDAKASALTLATVSLHDGEAEGQCEDKQPAVPETNEPAPTN